MHVKVKEQEVELKHKEVVQVQEDDGDVQQEQRVLEGTSRR